MIFQEQIFTKEECDKIIGYSKTYTNSDNYFSDAVSVDNNRLKSVRNTFSYDVFVIKNDPNTEWFFNKLLNWFSVKSKIQINKNNKVFACTLHCYKEGDRFPKHIDLAPGFMNRRYNLGIQLNDDYKGGEYVCIDQNENEILISKEVGTALAYHCEVPHEIKEITSGRRWSIVMPIDRNTINEQKSLI